MVLMLWVREIEQPLPECHMQSALRGSPGVREQSRGRLPEKAEEIGVLFGNWGGPEVFLKSPRMGRKGRLHQRRGSREWKRDQGHGEGDQPTGELTFSGFTGLTLLKSTGPSGYQVDGSLASWTQCEGWYCSLHIVGMYELSKRMNDTTNF